jgi:hypothetical protein
MNSYRVIRNLEMTSLDVCLNKSLLTWKAAGIVDWRVIKRHTKSHLQADCLISHSARLFYSCCSVTTLESIPVLMDDLYQLTADAVNQNVNKEDAEQNRQRQEQEDVVLKAFNSFGFSKRWDSLLDTVKKQVMSYRWT